MSEDNDKKIILEQGIQKKLEEISRILNILPNKVLNASLLHGLNRYRFPLQKYNSELKVEEQPVKEEQYQPILSNLKNQIELLYLELQNIDEFESMFEKKYSFGTFSNLQERETEYIKFLGEHSKPKEIESKEEQPKIPISHKIPEVEESSKEELEKEGDETPPIQGIFSWLSSYMRAKIHGVADVIKLMIVLILSFTANFCIFWGLYWWQPILFDIGYHLRYYPVFIPFMILLIGFIIIVISVIVGKIFYHILHKLQKKKSGKIT
ncbi:hypothetical protein LCGC14_1311570 [marine sediment metagenome]|uniref:Uncharacterized protein n=1 Tax=marine sediment metagenome TaxID=412755 RepID=A0A0F9L768_9ZZZZ